MLLVRELTDVVERWRADGSGALSPALPALAWSSEVLGQLRSCDAG